MTERTADGEKQAYMVRGIHQGEHLLYTMHDPDDEMVGAGSLFLSNDGGNTVHYIDENENTCHQWSQEELTATLSRYLLKTTDRFNVEASDFKLEMLLEEPADGMHGFDSQHLRYDISFNASYKYMLFKDRYEIERLVDVWTTPEVDSLENSPIFQKLWRYTGDSELDRQLKTVPGAAVDFRLRSETRQTSTDKKGKQSSSLVVQYLSALRETADLSLDRFKVPDCRQVSSEKMEKKFNALLKNLLG